MKLKEIFWIAIAYGILSTLFCLFAEAHPAVVPYKGQACYARHCEFYNGSAVIVGQRKDRTILFTAHHNIKPQGARVELKKSVLIGNTWYQCRVANANKRHDVAILECAYTGKVQCMPIAPSDGNDGDSVHVEGFDRGSPNRRYERRSLLDSSTYDKCNAVVGVVVPQGVSGGAIYTAKGLIGIVSAAGNEIKDTVGCTVTHLKAGLVGCYGTHAVCNCNQPPQRYVRVKPQPSIQPVPGTPGPTGKRGPPGPAGPPGKDGQDGKDGKDLNEALWDKKLRMVILGPNGEVIDDDEIKLRDWAEGKAVLRIQFKYRPAK